MSALEKMVADLLVKALPPEVMALLSPENIKQFGDTINGYIADTRERLERIEQGQKIILERLDNDNRRNNSNGNPE